MAKLSEAQTKLLTHATQTGGIYTGMYRPTINALIKKGYLVETSRNQFEATPAGLAYLYQDAPMADQPQPPSEVEPQRHLPAYVPSVGDVIIALDYPEYGNGTILEVYTDGAFVALVEWDNAPKAMITRATKIELTNDDLPFSDLGAEDTQELPIVADTPAMSLSQLVDAALLGATPCQRIDAIRTLRNGFDWTSVPSDALEAEVVDVNQAYEDAVANRRLLSSKMINDFWGYAELKDYIKAESFTWAVNAVYVLLNKQLSHHRLHAMGAYNA